jgi:hypothetical protein
MGSPSNVKYVANSDVLSSLKSRSITWSVNWRVSDCCRGAPAAKLTETEAAAGAMLVTEEDWLHQMPGKN